MINIEEKKKQVIGLYGKMRLSCVTSRIRLASAPCIYR